VLKLWTNVETKAPIFLEKGVGYSKKVTSKNPGHIIIPFSMNATKMQYYGTSVQYYIVHLQYYMADLQYYGALSSVFDLHTCHFCDTEYLDILPRIHMLICTHMCHTSRNRKCHMGNSHRTVLQPHLRIFFCRC